MENLVKSDRFSPFGLLRKKRVLVLGHTGFIGSWLTYILKRYDAQICGVSLPPIPGAAFESFQFGNYESHFFDLASNEATRFLVSLGTFDYIFHLAAQSLVVDAAKNPGKTYANNILATASVVEYLAMTTASPSKVVFSTSDKVYRNSGFGLYNETDQLGGSEPYSSSKVCVEEILRQYFFVRKRRHPHCVTIFRSGNVFGPGDHNLSRLFPTLFRALSSERRAVIRDMNGVRPWFYLFDLIVAIGSLLNAASSSHGYSVVNLGPRNTDCVLSVKQIIDIFTKLGERLVVDCSADDDSKKKFFEEPSLRLDTSLYYSTFGRNEVPYSMISSISDSLIWERSVHVEGANRIAEQLVSNFNG